MRWKKSKKKRIAALSAVVLLEWGYKKGIEHRETALGAWLFSSSRSIEVVKLQLQLCHSHHNHHHLCIQIVLGLEVGS